MGQVFAERTPQKSNATDAAAERETVITWSDADQVINISTAQARMITQLKNNPSATLVEIADGTHFFELPLGLITVRKGRKSAGGTKRNPAAAAQKCGAEKADGSKCQMVAKKETGRCRWHS